MKSTDKNLKIACITFLGLLIILCNACFSPINAETGNLTISWGDITRAFVQQSELNNFSYTVKLQGPGETIQNSYNYNRAVSASFKVIPGKWTVTVKGSMDNNLKVMGIEQVNVKPGKNSKVIIYLYTAAEVKSWAELNNAVTANDPLIGSTSREEIIIVKDSFEISDFGLILSDCTITVKRPIIIIAENDVIISRRAAGTSASFFKVENNGSLTLGKKGMEGSIIFDGKNKGLAAIITVASSSVISFSFGENKLILNDGVTLCNNNSGGVLLEARSADLCPAVFEMKGGTISGNTAVNGGGIYMGSGSSFTMNGGLISGNTAVNGGGIYVSSGNLLYSTAFIQKSGEISANTPALQVYYQP